MRCHQFFNIVHLRIELFRMKQIAMMGILGLALVLATAVYTQSAAAIIVKPGGGNGVNSGQTPPGWDVASGTPAVKHNPNLQGSTPSGGLGTNSGGQGYCHGGICTRG
jgi:transcription elongation factor